LAGKPECKISFGRHCQGWEDIVKMNLKEMESDGVYRIYLAQFSNLAGSCGHGNEHSGTMEGFLNKLTTLRFSINTLLHGDVQNLQRSRCEIAVVIDRFLD
jgi:hypothetical protein